MEKALEQEKAYQNIVEKRLDYVKVHSSEMTGKEFIDYMDATTHMIDLAVKEHKKWRKLSIKYMIKFTKDELCKLIKVISEEIK